VSAKRKKNPHVGPSISNSIRRWKGESPKFARAFEEAFDQLALARQIRALREDRHLSQGELARRAGTKQPAIARLESGRVLPRLDLLQKVAAALEARLKLDFVKQLRRTS
jgi:HTH-type transcriptional regulator/antitoxin HipB